MNVALTVVVMPGSRAFASCRSGTMKDADGYDKPPVTRILAGERPSPSIHRRDA
jgi:hypothetical protein